jgi:EmrB/QacA subfamily drug resistance transporter
VAVPAADARIRLTRPQVWTVTVSCASVSLIVAAMAALYGALPVIALDTGASQQQLTWIVDGYTLALACLVLPAGALGDRFGRRKLQLIGLLIFAFACGIPLAASGPNTVILARALAGVGAALVMPSTLSLITGSLPPERRARGIGIWAGVVGAGGLTGVLGAGLLLEVWSWRSIFWSLAGAALVFAALTLKVTESIDQGRPKLDPAGSILIAIAISTVVYGLMEGPDRGWTSAVVLGSFAAGAVTSLLFVHVELRRAEPLLDVRYFARRAFGSATLCVTLQFLVTFGLFLLLVQWFQLVLGYSVIRSALALAPLGPPLILLSVVSPWIIRRIGQRATFVIGLIAIGGGLFFFSRLGAGSTFATEVGPMLILSAGIGLCSAPATATIVHETPPEKHGVAAAVNDASRELGAALGIAIAGSALAATYSHRIHSVLSYLPPAARGPVSKSLAAALDVADRAGPRGKPLADLAKSAFLHGVDRAALVLAIISLVAAVVVGVWTPRRIDAPPHGDADPDSTQDAEPGSEPALPPSSLTVSLVAADRADTKI